MVDLTNRANIHEVLITPSGLYLFGLEPGKYNRILREDLRHIVNRILERDDKNDKKPEGSVASLAVGLESTNTRRTVASFRYLTTSVCLWELDHWTETLT